MSSSNKRQAALRRRYFRAAAILLIVALPVVLILVMNQSKQHFKRLGYFGPFDVAANGDTLRHALMPFEFQASDGSPFTADSLRGRVHIANFFFTTCRATCPLKSAAMRQFIAEVKDKHPDLIFISYTIDPETDTLQALQAYADAHGAERGRWFFVRGPAAEVYNLAGMGGYLVNAGRTPEQGPFHDDKFILVDKDLHIRGLYQSIDQHSPRMFDELSKLKDDIAVLYLEYQSPSENVVSGN